MATGGTGVDEVAQEVGTSHKDDEVGQNTGTANESNDSDGDAVQKDTGEHQGAIQVRNQNESGGLMYWAGKALSWVRKAPSGAIDSYRQWRSGPVSQCSYIDGDPNITSYEVIYSNNIERSSMTPYTFKFHDPARIITGIACLPKDAKTSSPECQVVDGGVGCKEVEIVLTPVQKGDWGCVVQIVGIAENRLEMDSTPKQLTE